MLTKRRESVIIQAFKEGDNKMKKENIVIKHHGLVILRENQVKLVSDTPYLSVADGSLEGIIDNKHITNTYNENIKTLSKNDTEKKQKWDSIEESFAAIGMNYERIIRLIKLHVSTVFSSCAKRIQDFPSFYI